MKKINIDDNNYIKVLPNGDFEIHCYAGGPTGANVYYFKNNNGGLLQNGPAITAAIRANALNIQNAAPE